MESYFKKSFPDDCWLRFSVQDGITKVMHW
jgi:hypothetical protein